MTIFSFLKNDLSVCIKSICSIKGCSIRKFNGVSIAQSRSEQGAQSGVFTDRALLNFTAQSAVFSDRAGCSIRFIYINIWGYLITPHIYTYKNIGRTTQISPVKITALNF